MDGDSFASELKQMNLADCLELLEKNGVSSLARLQTLTTDDLKECRLNVGQRAAVKSFCLSKSRSTVCSTPLGVLLKDIPSGRLKEKKRGSYKCSFRLRTPNPKGAFTTLKGESEYVFKKKIECTQTVSQVLQLVMPHLPLSNNCSIVTLNNPAGISYDMDDNMSDIFKCGDPPYQFYLHCIPKQATTFGPSNSAKSQSDTEAPPAISSPEESVSEKTNVASASGSLSGISSQSQSDTEAPPAISTPEESVSKKSNVASGSLAGNSSQSQSYKEAPPAISTPEESVSKKTNVASGSLAGISSQSQSYKEAPPAISTPEESVSKKSNVASGSLAGVHPKPLRFTKAPSPTDRTAGRSILYVAKAINSYVIAMPLFDKVDVSKMEKWQEKLQYVIDVEHITDEIPQKPTIVSMADLRKTIVGTVNELNVGQYTIVIMDRNKQSDDLRLKSRHFNLSNGRLIAMISIYKQMFKPYWLDSDDSWNTLSSLEDISYHVELPEVTDMAKKDAFIYVYQKTGVDNHVEEEESPKPKLAILNTTFDKDIVNVIRNMMEPTTRRPVKWDDVIGSEVVKSQIREAILDPLDNPELYKGPFYSDLSSNVLLYGPPGTGKTFIARAVATEAKANLFISRPSDLLQKYVGDGESVASCLFAAARLMKPSIIFVDECDTLFGKRSEGERSSLLTLKNAFLQEMDGFEDKVLVLASTNRKGALDEAFLRRLHVKIEVPLPSDDDRTSLIQNMMEKIMKHPSDKVAVDVSAIDAHALMQRTEGFSNAGITDMFRIAASKAITRKRTEEGGLKLTYEMSFFNTTD